MKCFFDKFSFFYISEFEKNRYGIFIGQWLNDSMALITKALFYFWKFESNFGFGLRKLLAFYFHVYLNAIEFISLK